MQAIDTGNANKKKQCLFPRSSHSNEDRQVENSNLTDRYQATQSEGRKRPGAEKTGAQKESFPWGWGELSCCLKDNSPSPGMVGVKLQQAGTSGKKNGLCKTARLEHRGHMGVVGSEAEEVGK